MDNGPEANFKPRIVGMFCNWCTYLAADLAGISRIKYSPDLRIARVMCSGRIHPEFVLWAFRKGADGVLIGGCHPGDCHYIEGNSKALRRYLFLKKLLPQFGIDARRLRLEWISGSEAEKLKVVANDFSDTIKQLGPLGGRSKIPEFSISPEEDVEMLELEPKKDAVALE